MQQLSGTLWGGSSMVERGPTHKHFVLSLWILVIALPGSAYFTHMTLIKMSRGLTHLLWGQSLITSIASGSITHAFKLHKYIHHVPPQSLCNKVYIIKHTFHLVRLIQEALQNIFTATHKINSLFRSDDKKSAGQSNSVALFPTLSVPSGSDIVPSGPAVVCRSNQPWRHHTVHTLEQGSQRGLNIIQSNKPSTIGHLNDLI